MSEKSTKKVKSAGRKLTDSSSPKTSKDLADNSQDLTCKQHLSQFLSEKGLQQINDWIAKYPTDQRQSAVMSALRIVQEEHGHLTSELMDSVADYLGMPAIAVYEVASFYSMYELKPIGTHLINVCTNISCMLRDSDKVVEHLQQKLGIQLGETTIDGRFTLRSVECLGACVNAPMMQVDKNYHENLTTTEAIDSVLKQYEQ